MTGSGQGEAAIEQPSRVGDPVLAQCFVYVCFGMPVAMLGVAWPQLREHFGQSDGALGILSVAYGVGRLVTAGSSQAVLRRVGFGSAVALGTVGLGASSVLVVVAPTWTTLVAAVLVVGLLSGVLDSLGARFLATHRKVSSAGLVTGSYGIGATIGPTLVAVTDSYRWSYGIAAGLAVGVALLVRAAPIHWPAALDHPDRTAADPALGLEPTPVPTLDGGREPGLPTAPALWLSLSLFFFFVGIEVTAGQWMGPLLEDARHVDHRLAGLSVSAFWAGITVGRLLLARLHLSQRMLVGASAVVAVAFALTGVAPKALVLPILLVAGVALSPTTPTLFAHTADRVGTALAQRVSGWQLIAANVAGIGLPALTGLLVGQVSDSSPAFVLVVAATAATVLLAIVYRRPTRAPATAPSSS